MPLKIPKDKQEIFYKNQETNQDVSHDLFTGYILHYLERCALIVDLESGYIKEIPYRDISFVE